MNQGSKALKKVQLSLSKMGLVAKVSPQLGEKEVQLQWWDSMGNHCPCACSACTDVTSAGFWVSSDAVEIEGIETWWGTPVGGMTVINWLYHSFQWNMHTFHVSSLLVVSLLAKYLFIILIYSNSIYVLTQLKAKSTVLRIYTNEKTWFSLIFTNKPPYWYGLVWEYHHNGWLILIIIPFFNNPIFLLLKIPQFWLHLLLPISRWLNAAQIWWLISFFPT